MLDLEIKGLEECTPSTHNWGQTGFNPLEIAVVSFYQELLATEVPRKRMYRVVNRVGFTLVGVPLLSRLRKSLGTEGNGLVGDSAVFGSMNLEQNGTNCVLTGVATNDPR